MKSKRQEKPAHSAFSYAIYLLAKREYSEAELRQKLAAKLYEPNEIDEAIAQAQQLNYQSDQRFCASFLRSRTQQGYGELKLRQELRLKGITDELISEQLAELELNWYDIAEQLFRKKAPKTWNLSAKQKMWRYMLSRGFQPEYFKDLFDSYQNDEE